MTEKLYYKDAYIREFTATVISCEPCSDRFAVVLDKTAFFPEEGGQAADNGTIDCIPVLDVKEKDSLVVHYLASPLSVGRIVTGKIDFDERYEKMKCHTAEHILCGIMHRLFGAENIGFHLGADVVTFDVSPILTRAELDRVEDMANAIVAENVDVRTYFPSADELNALEYRSKSEIEGDVRIVEIGEYDRCACCAPHVSKTGEIGLIKMLDFEKHRGGTRIYMLAGLRALYDYRARYTAAQRISALTSTPQADIVTAVEALLAERDGLAAALDAAAMRMARREAELVTPTDGNAVYLFDGFNIDTLREFVNLALPRVGGILVALSADNGGCKYVIGSRSVDLRQGAKEINLALGGKGGGRPEMIQGSFTASVDEIRAYFEK